MATSIHSIYVHSDKKTGKIDVAEDIRNVPSSSFLLGRIDVRGDDWEIANAGFYCKVKVTEVGLSRAK